MAISISIVITRNSKNVAAQTYNITAKVVAKWTYGSYNELQKPGWLSIDGTKYNFTSSFNTGHTTSGSQTLFTKTVNVPALPNASKKLTCSASYTSGVSSGTVTASGSTVLDAIATKSTMAASNGTLGTAQTLTVTKSYSEATHTITYSCGSKSGTISTKSSSTSISWTPPLTLASENTTGTSVAVKLTIQTFIDDTSCGTNTYTISCAIPSSVKPSCTVSISDPTGYKDIYGEYIGGKSKFKVTITPTLAYGSAIASYKTTYRGATYTESSFTIDVPNVGGTESFEVRVTDKRGRTSNTVYANPTRMAYTAPTITKLAVKRCDANGTENNRGEYVQVKFSAVADDIDNKNSVIYTLQYKKTTEDNYTTIDTDDYDEVFSVTNATFIFAADTGSSYDVLLSVKDQFGSTTRTTTASTAFTLMHWLSNGLGMAIGKVAELSNVFDVGLVTRIREHLNIGNKTGHLDGNTGVFISKEGYIQVQRDSSQGYHPYISFFHDEDTYHSGMIRQNCSTGLMEFTGADGYDFDNDATIAGDTYIGTTSSWEDGKCGVRMSKSGGLQIQRTSGSSPYIDFFFDGSKTYDSRIIHVLDDKRMKFKGASAYEFDVGIIGNTYMSLGMDAYNKERGINMLYVDDAAHWIVFRSADGLTSNFGWAGTADYATVTQIRGRTCKYQNSAGTTTLSDERLKKDFTDLEKWDKFFNALEPCAFKMKAGNSGRFHVGFRAQQVEQALIDAGLTTQDFAGFIKMKYTPAGDDPEGNAVYEEAGIKPGDDEYGLIYSEFVALNTFKIQKLETEVDNLKKELEELKKLLKNQ